MMFIKTRDYESVQKIDRIALRESLSLLGKLSNTIAKKYHDTSHNSVQAREEACRVYG